MMKHLALAKILIVASIFSASQASVSRESFKWEGDYLYQDHVGKTVGGSPIVVDMKLSIKVGSCLLANNGYQVSEKIVCKAVSNSTGKQITFVSYSNGKIENEFGVKQYQVGEVLFGLEQSQDSVLTTWHSLKPDNVTKTKGTFFVKVKTPK